MGEIQRQKEQSLRIAYPKVYEKMLKVFAEHRIHSYDTVSTAVKRKDKIKISLKFPGSGFVISEKEFHDTGQLEKKDELISFFEKAAEKCKSELIANYYKMIK